MTMLFGGCPVPCVRDSRKPYVEGIDRVDRHSLAVARALQQELALYLWLSATVGTPFSGRFRAQAWT